MKNTQIQKKEQIKSIDPQHCVIGLTDKHVLSKLADIKKSPMKLCQSKLNDRGIIL